MFTGLVEHIGTVKEVLSSSDDTTEFGLIIEHATPILSDCHLGDSIAINGTCLTVKEFDEDTFRVGLAPETLSRTNLGALKVGDGVNLERAMLPTTRMGGHHVQGHVDCTGAILSKIPDGSSLRIRVSIPDTYLPLCVTKGYIALDGTSLTLTNVCRGELKNGVREDGWIEVMLIEYTQQRIVIPRKNVGEKLNVEFDVIGKQVARLLSWGVEYQGETEGWLGIQDWIKTLVREEIKKSINTK